MSFDYYFKKNVQVDDLFWAKLKKRGVAEHTNENTNGTSRCLVGKEGGYMWLYVDENGYANMVARYGTCSDIRDDIYRGLQSAFGPDLLMTEHEFMEHAYAPMFERMDKVKAALKRSKLRLVPSDLNVTPLISELLADNHVMGLEITDMKKQLSECHDYIQELKLKYEPLPF